jgi:hypothetical protein
MPDRRFGTGMRDSDPPEQPGLVIGDDNEVYLVEPDGTRVTLGGAFNGGTIEGALEISMPDAENPETPLRIVLGFDSNNTGFNDVIQAYDADAHNLFSVYSGGMVRTENRSTNSGLVIFQHGDLGTGEWIIQGVDELGGGASGGVTKTGALGMHKVNSEPADSVVPPAGGIVFWFDKTNGAAKLKVKGKQADGTIVRGELALSA